MDDLISRQAVIDHINKKREEHLESADLINRQAAILALAEQIMESALMDNPTTASTDINRYRPIAELSLRDVPSAQPVIRTEMSSANDTISRQAAIDALDALCDRECEYSKKQRSVMCGACRLGSAFDVIDELPSAQLGQRYTNEELMIFQHGISLSLLSKRSAQHWQYDENTATEIKFLERLYEKVSANMRGGQNE